MKSDFLKIVQYASKAPSGHNTQPWKFCISEDSIAIIPNLEVSLPVVDSDNRELFISLGCALENLSIAANHFGYEIKVITRNTESITANFSKNLNTTRDQLFYQIDKRQTNRSVYNGVTVSDKVLEQFKALHKESHIQIYLIEAKSPLADLLSEYIMKGNEIQMDDQAFRDELLAWMRFNKKQLRATQDGLSYQVFGNPALPKAIARPIVSLFLKPNKQNKSDKKRVASSSHLVVCTTRHNSVEEWIDLGRTLQRFLLKATELGIAYAFMNQPCEVETLASKLKEVLPFNKEYPTLILRIGYAQSVPYSPRKEIETLLI